MLWAFHALLKDKKENLNIVRLRAVFQLQGRQGTFQQVPPSAQKDSLRRIECLRHLPRVEDVIRTFNGTLQPVVVEGKIDKHTVDSVQALIYHRLDELELLCQRPMLFPGKATFDVVYQLKGSLSYFRGLLQMDVKEALLYWKDKMAEQLKLALSAISQEVEQLLAGV